MNAVKEIDEKSFHHHHRHHHGQRASCVSLQIALADASARACRPEFPVPSFMLLDGRTTVRDEPRQPRPPQLDKLDKLSSDPSKLLTSS